MRTGRLDTPADLLALGADLEPVLIDWLWVGITAKDAGDVSAAAGLRNPGRVEVRAWWDERLRNGSYLRSEQRLLHVDSVRDVRGQQAEQVLTCTELIGSPASFVAQPGSLASPCRVFLVHEVARPGQFGGMVEFATQLEAAVVEVGRPQPGAVFKVGGVQWRVAGLVESEDDRIVRRMWVKRV